MAFMYGQTPGDLSEQKDSTFERVYELVDVSVTLQGTDLHMQFKSAQWRNAIPMKELITQVSFRATNF
ncbi:hypothetical protein LIER_41124 [Lithospermum erythrorhizon]|uniref:Uncharacterized protein n=1 Tax=Lithospermum erythrorhizon TaxID=34254 RepID=A0AAV3R608_LITER